MVELHTAINWPTHLLPAAEAAPPATWALIGGVVTSFIQELLVYPPICAIWKWNFEMKRGTVDVAALPLLELPGH